jgi:hypothetical protein
MGEYVYLIESAGCTKIGMTTNPKRRIADLQTSNPMPMTLRYVFECKEIRAVRVEVAAHQHFSFHRMRGEWFYIDADMVADWLMNKSGLPVALHYQHDIQPVLVTETTKRFHINVNLVVMYTALVFWVLVAVSIANALSKTVPMTTADLIISFSYLVFFTVLAIYAGIQAERD